MITLLASIAGFISSIFPELFKFLHNRADNAHELAIMQLQMQSAALDRDVRKEEIGAYADVSESNALYRTYKTGIEWVDGLNGTVRPVITYAFFLEYVLIKYLQYALLPLHAAPFMYLDALWTQEDQCIFAGVISFYFGQRAMNKGRK